MKLPESLIGYAINYFEGEGRTEGRMGGEEGRGYEGTRKNEDKRERTNEEKGRRGRRME